MPRDSRLSRMLHLLIHMDRHLDKPTSETLAKMLHTNPVVVRRMMAGLRERGLVRSDRGHGGGWALTRGLGEISLRDVYEAVGAPALFNLGPNVDRPECLVEQAVDARLDHALGEAEALLLKRFDEITVADLADDFETRAKGHPRWHALEAHAEAE